MILILILLSAFALASAEAWPAARAQSAASTLSGTVVDENGALVTNASVAVFNPGTGLQRQVLTDDEGYFVFPLLPQGTYTLRVERKDFVPVEIRRVTLDVGDRLAFRVQLNVGSVGAYVTVEDASGRPDSTSGVTTIDLGLAENLPLNGRSLQPLFDLAPGMTLTRATFNEPGQFSVNGQRANANYFTVDGVSANIGVNAGASPGQAASGSLPGLTALGGTNNLVSVESLQELRIQTSTYAPEFGRAPGAQVSIVTRSGTNQFRGTAFDYIRHDALNANDWFANSRGLPKAPLRQHNFGGVAGGPIVRDRAFFFFSYEGLRLKQPQAAVTEVPSLEVRHDASDALRPFLDAFPVPNGASCKCGFAEFAAAYSDPARFDAASLRLDTTLGDTLFIFGRFNYSPSEITQRGRGFARGQSGQSLNTLSRTAATTKTLTLGMTHAITPRLTNDLRFNRSTSQGKTFFLLDDFGAAKPLADSQMFPPDARRDESAFLLSISGGVSATLASGRGGDNVQRQLNIIDTLSFSTGAHRLKFGADYRRLTPIYRPLPYAQSIVFNGIIGAPDQARGGSINSGQAALVEIVADARPRAPLFTNFSAFAQDTWRPSPRLTFTYGLRWELNPPPSERNGNAPLTVTDWNNAVSQQLDLSGRPLWQTTYGNFAPRFGVAYQASQKWGTVVRGGFGFFYDSGTGLAAQAFGSVAPYVSIKRLSQIALPLAPVQAEPQEMSIPTSYDLAYAFDQNLKLPLSLQWNVAVEQPLGADQTVSVAYVAAAGRRLLRESLQPAGHKFRELRVITNAATSDYHSMQVQYQRRLARRWRAQASYTWSHAIDDSSEDSNLTSPVLGVGARPERSSSNFDVRHALSAAATYNFPAPGGTGAVASLLRGWSLDGILKARTATPFSVTITRQLLSGELIDLAYPDHVNGEPLYVEDESAAGGRRVNRAAFSGRFTGRSLGRNSLRGFGFLQADAAVRRQFRLTERLGLLLKLECFNVFNRPNFANPVSNLGSSLFGQSVQMLGPSLGAGGVNGGLTPLYQIGSQRSAQLVMKLEF